LGIVIATSVDNGLRYEKGIMMKSLPMLSLVLILFFALVGCTQLSPTMQTIQSAAAPMISTAVLSSTETVRLASDTPLPTVTLTPPNTLESVHITETLQPLIKEPMNCAVPCFWGIIPGETSFADARMFFSKLGFVPFEKSYEENGFYTIFYNSGSGHDSRVTLHIRNNVVASIVVSPDIPKPKEGSQREWIAYSPETLIKRYGSPSRVEFTVSATPIIGINMIMYFDAYDLIVHYSGYNMTPNRFCPSTVPFDFVRLWIGQNPPDTPSFDTVPLEKATSLTIDQFTQLMMGDSKTACFSVTEEVSP